MAKKTTRKKTTKKAASKRVPRKSASTARAKATKKTASKPAKTKRVSGLDLAAKVLAEAKGPLSAKAIAERTIAAGWKTSGKTPHATLYAAIIREISAKSSASRFKKVGRGQFATTGKAG